MRSSPNDSRKRINWSNAWRESRDLVWTHRRSLSLGLVLMVVGRLAALVLPASPKFLLDVIIADGRADLLPVLAGVVAGATVVQGATAFGLSQVVSVAAHRALTDMRRAVAAHVVRLPVRQFDATQSGVLVARIMTDAEGVRNLVGTGLIQLVGGSFTAMIALGVLLYLDWALTVRIVVLLLIFAAVLVFAFKRLRPIFRERRTINAEVTGRLTEALGGIRVVKTYVAERREDLVFTRNVHRLFRNVARSITGISAVSAFATVIVGAISVLLILGGGRAVIDGTLTVGDLVVYVLFVGLMVAPLVRIAAIGTQITEAFAGLDRIRELRQLTTEEAEDGRRRPLPRVMGDVALEDVSFEYSPDVPVLRNISLEAPAGTTTALVGPSGSGKSTLIGLIMGFYEPKSGRAMVDGVDLREVRLSDYRRHLGVVLQDNFLFDGTIRENIGYGRRGAHEEQIREAGRVAHCDEFINRFENGYETIVGERGIKLSGGQRQRIAIARAILADPRILILDEATSSLDSESELLIQDGLRSLRHGRTTFVIAHRLSTIQSADQILVLDGGRIVERGTHEELLTAHGLYRRLYEMQQRIETDRFVNPGERDGAEPEPGHETPATRAIDSDIWDAL